MAPCPEPLPADLSVAHEMIADLLRTVEKQQHELDRLKRYLYGQRSEKALSEPGLLIGAGLLNPSPEEEVSPAEPEEAEPQVSPEPRKRTGSHRRQTRANLRVERIEYPLPEGDCVCEACGTGLEKFGEEVTRQLDYVPASFYLKEHVRFKYACPGCKGQVKTSAMPWQPVEKGLPGPGLLANVLVSKYADHLPLYRQEQMYARQGIDLSRKTMCDWVRACADLLLPLYEWLKKDVLASKVVHTDDTPVPVQDRSRDKTRQGRLWVYVGDRDHAHVVYEYTASRSRAGPSKFLAGYRGYLQADAYPGYKHLYRDDGATEVGCWAHARRRFYEARKSGRKWAHTALAYIGRLYKIEREAKAYEQAHGLSGPDRAAYRCGERQQKSRPVLALFLEWLREQETSVLPKSPKADAVGYALAQWEALNRYLEGGDLAIDNNLAEQHMRPVALGRKNWLFAGSDQGGRRAAVIYSLIQSCKRNGVEPFAYLRDVLQRIPAHSTRNLHQLTPIAWKQAQEQPE